MTSSRTAKRAATKAQMPSRTPAPPSHQPQKQRRSDRSNKPRAHAKRRQTNSTALCQERLSLSPKRSRLGCATSLYKRANLLWISGVALCTSCSSRPRSNPWQNGTTSTSQARPKYFLARVRSHMRAFCVPSAALFLFFSSVKERKA